MNTSEHLDAHAHIFTYFPKPINYNGFHPPLLHFFFCFKKINKNDLNDNIPSLPKIFS